MKVSYQWLSRLVDLDGVTPEELANKFTFAGAEVEGVDRLASGTNLVIGHILECEPHPDSDHLHVLKVDEGEKYGVVQIVCGAPNARKGLKVIVARPGAKLPEVEIKPSAIRGVESNGMCCSLLELGVDRKFLTEYQLAGIEELPEDAPVGEENVLDYLGLGDTIIDLDLLPNRPDLYAVYNIAREAACLLSREVKIPEQKDYASYKPEFEVGSTAPKCPAFSIRIAHDVKNAPSPLWMKRALEASGIRSINAVVDIGNYVMLATGQPLNMYDLDKLPSHSLIVRDDLEEEFLAMDGNSYKLEKGDLVVTSSGKPMCLAGIMTADACRVDENTKNIAIEAANFGYAEIRRTSNRIGLASDSSMRFCKGISPNQAEEVLIMASALLKEICGAEKISSTSVYDSLAHEPKRIATSLSYINSRLGTSFSEEEVLEVLKRDNLKLLSAKDGEYEFEIPSYRIDMDGEADISEEVIRILGYDNVKSILPYSELALTGLTLAQQKTRSVRNYLLANGVNEALTYTLTSKEATRAFAFLDESEPYVLQNPMTVEREAVRKGLADSLLQCATYNAARQNKDVALFEVSDVDSHGRAGKNLCIVLSGSKHMQGSLSVAPYSFFDAKGLVYGVLAMLGLGENRFQIAPWSLGGEELHPGRSAEIRMGKRLIGYIGELHPLELKRRDLKNAVVAELDFSFLLEQKTSMPKASIPPRFPSVSRDLAFLVDSSVSYASIKRELQKTSSLLKGIEIFDLYQGANIVSGKKSMALTLTFLAEDRTLREEEVADATKKVVSTLASKFGAEVRS